ncbi:MAG: DNA polymerase I, partial [Bacteroidetes bacterium]|nr:DNA polymerase I [Bacteroidota bacterium]
MGNETIYVIDGSAYIYRAYHAIAPLTNSKGLPTNAVYGFVNMLRKLINEKRPEYVCVAFDSRGPVFRHELYSDYKANRPPMPEDLVPQIPYIKSLINGFNIVLLEEQQYEADDIIASLAVQMGEKGHDVVIVSGDKDLLQLVTDKVVMWDPMKDQKMTPEIVEEKYGVRITQLLDYFALIGDSSDNVPGVPGIGPKTATRLISEYGSLDGIYESIDSMKKSKMKERLIEHRDGAYLSRELIRLREDLKIAETIEDLRYRQSDDGVLSELYKELEFTSLLQEVRVAEEVPVDNFNVVTSASQLEEIGRKIGEAEVLIIDTETTSLDVRKAELVGLSLCLSLDEAWYIPVGHKKEDGTLLGDQVSLDRLTEFLQPFLTSVKILKLGHNLKYDYTVLLQNLGIKMAEPLGDTMIAAYL